MAEAKQVKSVTFTGPDGEDVTVTGPAALVLAQDAARGTTDFDADVEFVAEKTVPAKAPAKAADTK